MVSALTQTPSYVRKKSKLQTSPLDLLETFCKWTITFLVTQTLEAQNASAPLIAWFSRLRQIELQNMELKQECLKTFECCKKGEGNQGSEESSKAQDDDSSDDSSDD